eukprot:4216850-Heterocapsa_arctica.AAC.1
MEVDACGRPSPEAEEDIRRALHQLGTTGVGLHSARSPSSHSAPTNLALSDQNMEDIVRASAAIAVSRDPRLRAALAAARENDAAR